MLVADLRNANADYYDEMDYGNFKELKKEQPKLAKHLLDEEGKGDWMNDTIRVYPSLIDYAEYEVTDGWYANLVQESYGADIDNDLSELDYNGAPDLDLFVDDDGYIDYKELGKHLPDNWDASCNYFDEDTNQVVTTDWGF